MESRENPRGKRAFRLGLFLGFSRMLCIRVGRFQRPGQKHSGIKFSRLPSSSGKLYACHVK